MENSNSRVNNLSDIQKLPLEKLCKDYKIKTLVLFGSFAKGTQTPESDVDFLVEWHREKLPYRIREKLPEDLKRLTGRDVDIVSPYILGNRVFDYEINTYGHVLARG
jgi:predicted nucleotidyltransferase